jgi:poly-gamma-glutamate synthesis protein (capsule biosynthesis protein)
MNTSIHVAAVGDLQLGDSPVSVGFGLSSRYRSRGLDDAFSALRPVLAGADFVFGNLECPLSTAGLDLASWRSAQLRGDPSFAGALARAGFTVLNVANNHAAQHGITAFRETVDLLAEHGIRCCGVRGVGPWCSEPVVLPIPGNRRVGILGYCQRPRQYGPQEPPFAEGRSAEILSDVERLRGAVDAIVVSLHWGEEFVSQPSRAEVALAHAVIEAGAALIIGHHPHVLRPVERYRHGLVAYSLGNCIADMVWWRRLRQGGVLRCTLDASGAESAELTPIYIDVAYRPAPLARSEGNGLHPLDEQAYRRAVRRTVRSQRAAAYRHAALNVWRYSPRMLGQLAANTIQNKARALRSWFGGRGGAQ